MTRTVRATILIAIVLWLGARVFGATAAEPASSTTRFSAVQIFVDAGAEPLAAYQVAIQATTGDVKIVGIEGGEHAAFREAPIYDPKAIQQERVILAAFSLKPRAELPTGRTRVATLHLQVTGDVEPAFEIKLRAAANHAAIRITPEVSVEPAKP